jgi:hypothetical protein
MSIKDIRAILLALTKEDPQEYNRVRKLIRQECSQAYKECWEQTKKAFPMIPKNKSTKEIRSFKDRTMVILSLKDRDKRFYVIKAETAGVYAKHFLPDGRKKPKTLKTKSGKLRKPVKLSPLGGVARFKNFQKPYFLMKTKKNILVPAFRIKKGEGSGEKKKSRWRNLYRKKTKDLGFEKMPSLWQVLTS